MNALNEPAGHPRAVLASQAGVQIDPHRARRCTLRPACGHFGQLASSIVGRFLEHHRVYGSERRQPDCLFSADWLERNLLRRIETDSVSNPNSRRACRRSVATTSPTTASLGLGEDGAYGACSRTRATCRIGAGGAVAKLCTCERHPRAAPAKAPALA
jgi:polyphosphate kinase